MIKKIRASQLKVGMYVHDLNCSWMAHPFVRNRFRIEDRGQLQTILATEIGDVFIDTSRGMDVANDTAEHAIELAVDLKIAEVAKTPRGPAVRLSAQEEMSRARRVHAEAEEAIRDVLLGVRIGKPVELNRIEPLVTKISASLLGNRSALLSLCRIKDSDRYTFLHSVSVGTLMIAFSQFMNMDADAVMQNGIGGLLHDTGKMFTPLEILNKPGRLTPDEFVVMKKHPGDGYDVLRQNTEIGEVPLEITLRHHERLDGSGYPGGFGKDAIPHVAKMAAIVDVYDAITAERCYHRGMPPTEALRRLIEWSGAHFDGPLVHEFIRCIGIYPVGSLVLLESGRVAIVTGQDESSPLTPQVVAVYDSRKRMFIAAETIDLAKPVGHGGADRITAYTTAEQWGIRTEDFL